jgi:O-antigen ligase
MTSPPRAWTVALGVFAAIFLALVAYGVARNLEKYGIRAPGEFRHRYLVLGASLYVAVFFDSIESRLRLLRVLSALTVFVIFAAVPIVAVASGWIPGSGERLFPADVSLALLFGLSGILLMKWNGLRFMETAAAYLCVPLGVLQIVLDNHRSVWLAAMAVILFLLVTKQISFLRMTAAAAVLFLVSLAGKSLVSAQQGRSFSEFLTERAMAFTNPEADGTASWRVQQWEAQMPKFRENPVFGIGLGGYWGSDDNMVAGNLGVMPHNYYVGTLVKLGATGLAAYIAVMVTLGLLLTATLRGGGLAASDRVICLLGLLSMFGAHAYYSAYWLDAATWIWIGLAAAACIHLRRPVWLVQFDW